MTTSDKTGEKLVASIRRTKASAAAAGDPAVAKKPTTSQEAGGKTSTTDATTVAPETNMSRDRYQSAGRVWPD